MLPDTTLGRATRSSFMSLRLQLEKRFAPSLVVMKLQLEVMGSMQRLTLFIGEWEPVNIASEENILRAGGTVADTIEQLRMLDTWLSNHVADKIGADFENNVLTLTAKPNIKAVPKVTVREERLLLIDGSNILTTSYYATKSSMIKNNDGIYTNGVFVMTKKILDLISRSYASHIAIAWDEGRDKTFRRKLYPEYKAQRKETEPELKQQFSTARTLFAKLGIAQYSHQEIEADDIIGTIATRWEKETKGKCFIISNDKDLYQLVSDRTMQLTSSKSKEYAITPDKVLEKYKVTASQWADCKALLGDTSDNVPGVNGVGDKAVYPLIAEFGSLEKLYENLDKLDGKYKRYVKKLEEGKELAFLSKQLVQLRIDADDLVRFTINDLKLELNRSETIKQFRLIGFKSLIYSLESGDLKIG